MESGHAEVAVLLIEAGADRHRVRLYGVSITHTKLMSIKSLA